MAKAIMIQGTSSGAGKTTLALALCRIFTQDGFKVAPFKSQNMTSNTASTAAGDIIAVSQLLQALAARTEPIAEMNPVILSPISGGHGVQVTLNGSLYDNLTSAELNKIKIPILLPEILKAYEQLSSQYDIIVIEGAGSPVELNLSKDDIVNMGLAKRLGSPVLLVADIDRGGVFASLYGTVKLLDESERAFVKATVVNRFKGDISQFADGRNILELLTEIPVAGVIPYISIDLPEEDGLAGNSEFGVRNSETSAQWDSSSFEEQFDKIADNARHNLDMRLIYRILDGI